MSNWWSNVEAKVQSALTYSEAEINSFFAGVESAEAYVVKFFQNEGPILIKDATDAKTSLDGVAAGASVAFPGAAAEIQTVQTVLDGALTLFVNLVTGLAQGAQQGSGAQMAVSPPSMRSQLTALRNAQSKLDIAKANAAIVIAKYGTK